jgi:RNA polymerase-binding transcription factor
MNLDVYKRALMDLRTRLSARAAADAASGREQRPDSPGDSADAAIADESESESFSAAERDSAVLQQVEAALGRIEDGTYGRCLVDGGPIEAQRLEAVPWAAYCITHQELLEAGSRPKPTL